MLPPEHLRTVVAGRRAAGQLGDAVAVRLVDRFDVGLAAHIQPGVEAGRRAEVFVDRADAGHLTVEGDGGDVTRVDPAGLDTLAHGGGGRTVKIVVFLFDHARHGVIERHFAGGFRHQCPVCPVQRGLGGAGSQINAD